MTSEFARGPDQPRRAQREERQTRADLELPRKKGYGWQVGQVGQCSGMTPEPMRAKQKLLDLLILGGRPAVSRTPHQLFADDSTADGRVGLVALEEDVAEVRPSNFVTEPFVGVE